MKLILRRLRGALGNAVVWGVSWLAGAWGLLLGAHLLGWLPTSGSWAVAPWTTAFWFAANLGSTGFVTGGAFSAFLRFAYADGSLPNIGGLRFAAGGAMVAALLSPALTLVARAGWGVGLPVDMVSGVWVAAVFGAVTAGSSIRIAQRASRSLTEAATAELEIEQRGALALLENRPDAIDRDGAGAG